MNKLYFNRMDRVLTMHLNAGQSRTISANILSNPNVLRGANKGIIPDAAFTIPRKTLDIRKIMEACMGGQFMIETRAGRDAFSQALLKHIEGQKSRHGLDGLFLTVMTHLEQTHSSELPRAKQLWATTTATAAEGEVAFDSRSGEVVALHASAFDSKHDPLQGGLAKPAFQQKLEAARGGSVMDVSCQQWFAAGGTIAGAYLGMNGGALTALASGVGANPAGVIGGAIVGGLGGASAGTDIGNSLGAVICGWASADAKTSSDNEPTGPSTSDNEPTGPPTSLTPDTPSDKPDSPSSVENPTPPKDGEGGGGPPDGGWPPANSFPAPDDGGGNPWSTVAIKAVMTVSQAAHLMTPAAGGGFITKAFDPMHIGANAFDPAKSLTQHLFDISSNKSRLTPVVLKGLTEKLKANGLVIPTKTLANV